MMEADWKKKLIMIVTAISIVLLFFFVYDSFKSRPIDDNIANKSVSEKESDKAIKKLERDMNSNSHKIITIRNTLNENVNAFSIKHKEFKENPKKIFQEEIALLSRIKNEIHEEEHLWKDRKAILQKLKEYNKNTNNEYLKRKSEELYNLDKGFIENDLKSINNILLLLESQIESDREIIQYLKRQKNETKEQELELIKKEINLDFKGSSFRELYEGYQWTWSQPDQKIPHHLIPEPNSFQYNSEDQLLPIYSLKHKKSFLHLESDSNIVKEAFNRYQDSLTKLKDTQNKIEAIDIWKVTHTESVSIKVSFDKEISHPQSEDDESYKIEITNNHISISAKTTTGVIRAFSTLKQLTVVSTIVTDKLSFLFLRPCVVEDAPRFSWRGLMIDSARHFQSFENIKRSIDAMELCKLNVLHMHLSDDQGFRFESFKYPLLHEKSSNGQYYKQSEIKEIVSYAALRGIRVVPEIDVPGHTTALLYAYPDLTAGTPPDSVSVQFGMRVNDRALDIGKDDVYSFLEGLFGEISHVFPDKYIHIGGDEVTQKAWNDQNFLNWGRQNQMYSIGDLQLHFNKRLFQILEKLGKVPVGWDEILHDSLPRQAVIQSWRGASGLERANSLGFHSVLSSEFYLDGMKPASAHYTFATASGMVFGGEACAWSEFIHDSMLDMVVWPRLVAISEKFWSKDVSRDQRGLYLRLGMTSSLLNTLGLQHIQQRAKKVEELYNSKIKEHHKENAEEVLEDLYFVTSLLNPKCRVNQVSMTSVDPMDDLIDSLVPESYEYHAFSSLLDSWVIEAGSSGEKQWWKIKNYKSSWLRRSLELWASSAKNIKAIFSKIPHLSHFNQLIEAIENTCNFGISIFDADDKSSLQSKFNEIERYHNTEVSLVTHVIYHPIRKFYDLVK